MENQVPAIEVTHASRSFRPGSKALDDISFTVQGGQCVGLLGASGSGKSTLLRSLCGLERLDTPQGAVRINGETLQSGGRLMPNARSIRKHTAIIFQQFNLVGRMALLTNVLTGVLPTVPVWRCVLGRFTQEERLMALQALHAVGLDDHATQRASTLSGGQQQRAAIARALVQGASVLLADEPVASLDPESSRRVMELLRKLNREQGKTLIMSLHDVALARRYCDRIVALRHGRLVYDGAPNGLDHFRLNDLYGSQSDELVGADEVVASRHVALAA